MICFLTARGKFVVHRACLALLGAGMTLAQAPQDPASPGGLTIPSVTLVPPGAAPAVPATPPVAPATNAPAGPQPGSAQDPAVAQLDFANGLFKRQFFDMALVEYLRFKDKFPGHPLLDEAYYRMGECQRELKFLDQAKETFRTITRQWPGSEYSGRAHFRLGEMAYQAKQYPQAVPLFLASAHQTNDDTVRTAATFYLAKAQIEIGQMDAAMDNLRRVLKSKTGAEFRPFAEAALAGMCLKEGNKNKALEHYENLLDLQTAPDVREEALYQVGALRFAQKAYPSAVTAFRQFMREFPRSHSTTDAAIGLARALYETGKHREAATVAREWYDTVPKEVRPEMAMMVAVTLRDDNAHREAADWFEKADTPAGRVEAVRCAFMGRDYARVVQKGEALLKAEPKNPYIESVLLLVAEGLEAQKEWVKAGEAYRQLMERFPSTTWAADARWHAATCWQQAKKIDEAAREFERVANDFPKDLRNEAAWYQLAVFSGQLDRTNAMVAAFDKLQTLYPKSPNAAEAHYWIGGNLLQKKEWAKAAEHLEAALAGKLAKNRVRTANAQLVVAYYQLENAEKTLAHAQMLVDGGTGKLIPAEICGWIGSKMYEAGKLEASLNYLKMALDSTSDAGLRIRCSETAARAAAKLGRWEQAAACYRDVIEFEGRSERGFNAAIGLAEALLRTGEFKEGKDTLEKLLEWHPEGPENARVQMLLGELYTGMKNHREAARYFMRVAALYDDRKITPEALHRAAKAFDACGRTGDAAQARRELDQRFPTYRMFSGEKKNDTAQGKGTPAVPPAPAAAVVPAPEAPPKKP